MRVKGGKSREALIKAVLRGDLQTEELPNTVRRTVSNALKSIEDEKAAAAAKAEAEAKKKAAAKPKKTKAKVKK